MTRAQRAQQIFNKYSKKVQISVRKQFELRLELNKPVTKECIEDSLFFAFVFYDEKWEFSKEKYQLLEELLTLFF